MTTRMKQDFLRLPTEWRLQIEQVARERGMSKSQLYRIIVYDYLRRQEEKEEKEITL